MSILAKIKPGFRPGANGLQSLGGSVKSVINGGGGGWWDMESGMDDASGNGNTLTEVATPTYTTTGKPGEYVQLTGASNQYGTIADNASLSCGAGKYLTCGGWFYYDSTAGVLRRVLAKGNVSTAATCEYSLGFSNVGAKMRFSAGDGVAVTNVTDTFVSVSLATWYFIAARYKVNTGQIGINVNMSGWVEAAFAGPILDGTNAFRIGQDTGGARQHDGRLDSIFVAYFQFALPYGRRVDVYQERHDRKKLGAALRREVNYGEL